MHHEPVMLAEVLEVLSLKPGSAAADGTLGLAGHGREIAARIAPGGLFLGMDWDLDMLEVARERLKEVDGVTVALRRGDYRELPEFIEEACVAAGRAPQVDAALLDLGLNNAQIEDPSRGISFRESGPLDMRMDRSRGETAASLLNRAGPFEIEKILKDYGDENWARKIAQIIVDRRKKAPLQTTDDLVDCVMAAIPPSKREKRIHPATRTFQAIRIAVNHELDDLESCLTAIARRLAPGGVFAVLSYHSGEDRATKRAFRELSSEGYEEVFRKPLVPSADEVARNPKSRSAKLRALRRGSASIRGRMDA
ncbi:MAG: 16S rRNA (cytosine(1402)-N(4))-methyltransferase RsmH [Fimbriimonadaceae bacterium]|nr:16S rRNA (cytosine(1402)-N(4))-methyltransferase RsmH [Fimbriimonadaceae bacterium]